MTDITNDRLDVAIAMLKAVGVVVVVDRDSGTYSMTLTSGDGIMGPFDNPDALAITLCASRDALLGLRRHGSGPSEASERQ